MKEEINIAHGGVLRRYIEEPPENKLGLETSWMWKPLVPVDKSKLLQMSPTTEYTSAEGQEQ